MTWRAGSITASVLPVDIAPRGRPGAGSPSYTPATAARVDCPPRGPRGGVGVRNACRAITTAQAAQAAGSDAGTATFTGDTGCYHVLPDDVPW